MLDQLGDIGYVVFVISSILFTISFLTLSKSWYKSFMGVVIAVYLIGTDILCVYFGLRIFEVDVPGVDIVRFIIFWMLALAMIGGLLGLYNVQFSRRGERLRRRLSRKHDDVNVNETHGPEERA